jgi:hypothetical protein
MIEWWCKLVAIIFIVKALSAKKLNATPNPLSRLAENGRESRAKFE